MNTIKHIVSFYCANIPPRLLYLQERVFSTFGYRIHQQRAAGRSHGDWLDETIDGLYDEDDVLVVDIDAFPLHRDAITVAFEHAQRGDVLGLAQTANHLSEPRFVYAGPSFLCFRKSTWVKAGRPSMRADEKHDVGMRLSKECVRVGIPMTLLYPCFVCRARWPLSDRGWFGHGTFYSNWDVFHLFESRYITPLGLMPLYETVANRAIAGERFNLESVRSLPHLNGGRAWAKWI